MVAAGPWRLRAQDRAGPVAGTLSPVRIARFTTRDEPQFGVAEGDGDDLTIVALAGDPLYHGVQPTGQQIALDDVRLLAPGIPRSKVVGIGRNYDQHAAEIGNHVPTEPLVFFKHKV